MSEIAKLLERVEKATGPDRELDAAVYLAIFQPAYRFPDPVLNRVPANMQEAHGRFEWDGVGGSGPLAPYTASVDAALALVERTLGKPTMWSVCIMEDGPFAQLLRPMPDGGYIGGLAAASGNTAPLAILAALLTALRSQEDKPR